MGQKVHPVGFRLGINRTWESRWFARNEFSKFLLEDARLRKFIIKRTSGAGVARVEIERAANRVIVVLHTAKPGIIIGRGGSGVDRLRSEVEEYLGKDVHINVQEVRTPELDAQLVADALAQQITRRVAFRRAMRQAVQRTMRAGAKGVKVICSGRLGGHEMARRETLKDGSIPLHTLRAYIDYGLSEAATTYGNIGVKVWVYTHDVLAGAETETREERGEGGPRRGRERISSRERATVTVSSDGTSRGNARQRPAVNEEDDVSDADATED